MEKITQIIGFFAAALTTISFLPQAIKTWKTKSTDDLSPFMFIMFFIGIAGWLWYGFLRDDLPMILANTVTIFLSGIILFFILRRKKTARVAHIGVFVEDLEGMKDFYCAAFGGHSGVQYHNPKNKFTSYFISLSGKISIELMHMEGKALKHVDQQHIAIKVGGKKEVDKLTAELQKQGVSVLDGPRNTGDGYYESKIQDPEGNCLELTN